MNLTVSKLIMCCLAGLLMVVNAYGTIPHQGEAKKQLRVLIDASKDGGLWWFPQGPNFNERQHHQGKALADFMRGMGWKVTEVPRGEVITFDGLRNFDLVIRPPAFFAYSEEEALAYQQSVTAGTRLLLAGGSGKDGDAVAEGFGLHFETRNRFGSVKQWIPHALTTNIESGSLSWTALRELPPGAVVLAWLNQVNTTPQPVLGYLSYGKGSVIFVGQALVGAAPNRLFADSLIKSVGRYTPEEIPRLPMATLVVSDESVELGPRLLQPVSEATLPQPSSAQWRFDWEDVPAAKSYEIVVLGASALFPLVRTTTNTSDYSLPVRDGYISDSNLLGWGWRVRAQYQNGTWGPWSRTRRFNVRPRF